MNEIEILDKIMRISKVTTYDFRMYANPTDELSHLFQEWVDYYKLKYSIAQAIQPKSILEIGVRYGYSARAFLEACPMAHYLGIDNDSDSFGGSKGAINWASQITEGFKASFHLGDSQSMVVLPGENYDLVHIDGQQDGDGTYHDLLLALEKSGFILLDGYMWSEQNMLSATYFLRKYGKLIDYALFIPGYAGELLIKPNALAREFFEAKRTDSVNLSKFYDDEYYLHDCGGYDVFTQTNGQSLDGRLSVVFDLVASKPDDMVLDVGFGRGELAYSLAGTGANVLAIDYSESAIEIANNTYASYLDGRKLKFALQDVCEFGADHQFDKIVASDVIEHVNQDSIGIVYAKISQILKPNGVFVIHTAPNLWYYQYTQRRKRRIAKEIGMWVPKDPRSLYEELMHINEQTPACLKRELKKYFSYVEVWTANPSNPADHLQRSVTKAELCLANSIYAVASNTEISRNNIVALLTQEKLSKTESSIQIICNTNKLEVRPKQVIQVPVTLYNRGTKRLSSMPPYPVYISYHWYDGAGNILLWDGIRTPIRPGLRENASREFTVTIEAPEQSGSYILGITLVQEGCFWFDDANVEFMGRINVCVFASER
jgi:2-polyprenyl-3-methyl-5-hydroxy-6-metoxy-1,4-benzoquinol methylase